MKIELKLDESFKDNEIIELNDFIKEQNLKGIISKITQKDPEPGTMSAGDWIPIIQLILGSTAVAAGVKGIFNILEKFFELKKQQIISKVEAEKYKLDQNKIECVIEMKDSTKVNLKFSSFSEDERNNFFSKIDKLYDSNTEPVA